MAWSAAGNIRGPQGPSGPQGPQGPTGVSGIVARGAWVAGNAYAVNDLVQWGGSSYIATAPHATNTAPPTGTAADPGTDDNAVTTGWAVFAVQGAAGPQGIQGTAGSQGVQGPQGVQGNAGPRGTNWYTGSGAPGTIAGSLPGDKYLDTASGDVYTLS